jgi:acyl-CoA synthetase (NDP forming)
MSALNSTNSVNNNFWHSLFAADSIAVIGANNILGSWGCDAIRTAMASTKADARKQVFAVNPNIPEIQGLKSFNTILDIPGPVELAIIVVPAALVPSVMRQCAQKQVKAAVIISAGFGETDEAGVKLEAEVVAAARAGGIHFVGPNCLGHADAYTKVASAGVAGRIGPGPMALISQSGTLGSSIAMVAANHGIGLSKFVGTGNEADLHLEDYLEYLAQDELTKIIAVYIEGLREGRRFFRLAQEITLKKPIVAIKTGATSESSRAARSHTGALSGSDAIYTAAFKQAGVIRAEDEEELSDVVLGLLYQPLPRGNRIGILTMGGGFGVVTAESCEKEGLKIASLEPHTLEKLNGILPPRWSHGNPVDLVGIKAMSGDNTVTTCLRLLMEDRNVDTVISLLPPVVPYQFFSPNMTAEQQQLIRAESRKSMDFLNQQVKLHNKPLVLIRRLSPQINHDSHESSLTPEFRIPEYSNARRAARALRHLAWYHRYLEGKKVAPDKAAAVSYLVEFK